MKVLLQKDAWRLRIILFVSFGILIGLVLAYYRPGEWLGTMAAGLILSVFFIGFSALIDWLLDQ